MVVTSQRIVGNRSEDRVTIEKYFIKTGYSPNEQALTVDKISGGQYWNKWRVYSSYYYQFPVYQYAKKLIQEKGIKKVIDVGCGVASKLALIHDSFPEVDFVGIDQKDAIDYCKENYGFGSWYVDNIENPDESLDDIKADLVICSDVIEHLVNPDFLLSYLKKKVTAGGYILLSTPERDILGGKSCTKCPNKFHVREWNYNELENYLLCNGLCIVDHFLQYPIRLGINRIFLREVGKRLIAGKALRYNQVCLLQVE